MKKHLKKTIATIVLLVVLNIIVHAKGIIPSEVEKVVMDRFPKAQDIEWTVYSNKEYLASFLIEEQEVMVFIDINGKFLESNVHLNEAHIPQTIADQIAVVDGAELCYVLETTSADNVLIYRAKVKVKKDIYEYDFDNSGRIVLKRKM
jgi:hypothetical protein